MKLIKCKSIYAPIEKDDGIRILITRYHPRGIDRSEYCLWLNTLAPSKELLKQWKNGEITWDEFERKLLFMLNDIEDNGSLRDAICGLLLFTNVTLLCYEKDGEKCHRYAVRDWIMECDGLE